MSKDDKRLREMRPATVAVHAGRAVEDYFGFVNPPVYHGSTVLHPTAQDFRHRQSRYQYGSLATPTSEAFENAVAALENADGCRVTNSGRAAIVLALMSALRAGDHLLLCDNVYRPTRMIADSFLTRFGVETTYFDPLIGDGIAGLFRDNTRAVYVESPGSQTFEMPDIPAIAAVAHDRDALVLMDNTWATPVFFQPFRHGVDISIHAATKYLVGHSDAMLGAVTGIGEGWKRVDETFYLTRFCAGPDDVYLGHRGLRTLPVRLRHHMQAGLEIARWLAERPEVSRVLHPALDSDPGHAIWRRDFTGAASLFSVILEPASETAVDAFLDAVRLFGMGASWGGYESLVVPFDPTGYRTATRWEAEGPALRFHVGLEDTEDLKADLDRGFAALRAAS